MWTPGLTPVLASTLLLVTVALYTPPVTAQPISTNRPQFTSTSRYALPLFENLTLTPNQVATSVRGISGGTVPAAQVAERAETATGPCVGFIDTQPDHVLTLTEPFNGLSLQVQSAEDTTLVIKGPGGSWCNDNYTSANPGIAGQWLPGTYDVWVGSHRSTGFFPYVIRIFEVAPPPGLPPVPTGVPAAEPQGSNTLPEATPAGDEADSNLEPSQPPINLPTVAPSLLPEDLPTDPSDARPDDLPNS